MKNSHDKITISKTRSVFCLLIMFLTFFLFSSAATAQVTSALWGVSGEAWDPTNSPLLDFSDVGYMHGDVAIPNWPIGVNVTNFGAVADDGIDDSQAFNDAIAACPANHAVFVPNGRYTILQRVVLDKDYIVVRGEDMYQTILFFPKNLSEVEIMEAGYDPSAISHPTGAFFEMPAGTHRSIENLTFQFRDQMKMGHWEHKGNDAIEIKADNSWVRNLYIKNADHGIQMNTSQVSFINIIFDHFAWRQGPEERERVGHMAIKPTATKCLFHNIEVWGAYTHDFDIDGGTRQNVFSNVKGTRPRFDAHGGGAFENLHTQADHGWNTELTVASSAFSTQIFWNIYGDETLDTTSIDQQKNHVFVGYDGNLETTQTSTFWYENIEPQHLFPQNIYLAQLEYFGKPLPEGPPPPPPADTGDAIYVIATEDAAPDFRSPDRLADPHSPALDSRFQMYFKFDLQDVELNSIHRVRLVLGVKQATKSSDFTLWSVDDDTWSEDSLSHNNRPLPQDNLGTVLFDPYSGPQQFEFDVTSFVQTEWAGDKIVSFNLDRDLRDFIGLNIRSRDYWWPPTLIIEQVADPVPGAPSAPKGIGSTPLVGNIILDWDDYENNPDEVVTYNVYRNPFSRGQDGYGRPVGMGLVTSDFVDVDSVGNWRVGMMEHEHVYFYQIVAVDEHGYESERSQEFVAATLHPSNAPPAFSSTVSLSDATKGDVYNENLGTEASDPESNPMYFMKVSGPDWLNVALDGTLSGMPGPGDVGINQFIFQVTAIGGSAQKVVNITVVPDAVPPAVPTGLVATPGGV